MIKYFPKHKGYILFGTKQLFEFGIHIGHIFKKSKFYARWLMQGVGTFFFFFKSSIKKLVNKWVSHSLVRTTFIKKIGKRALILKKLFFPVFIINLTKSILGIRSLIFIAQFTGLTFSRGWFICHNHLFIPFTLRYSLLLGMGYSVYDWIAGCLTNFKTVFNLFFLLYREYLNGLLLEKKHYMFIYRLLGFNLTGFWVPSFLFFPRILESRIANWEGGCLFAKSIALIDSNTLSGDTTLPLASNDDSFMSVNFFFYIFSFHILKHLLFFLKKWRQDIRTLSRRKFFWIMNYFTFFYRIHDYKYLRSIFSKFFVLIYKTPYFFYDGTQISTDLTPFGVFRFGLNYDNNNLDLIDTYLNGLK